jgi:glycine/D-amino acid oxidase-like deaminating enzyme
MSETDYDAIVIGGGIGGVSIGYELAEDRQVCLLEQESTLGCCRPVKRTRFSRASDAIHDTTYLTTRHVQSSWAGLRSFVPDRTPVVGFDPHVDGFFWCAGQGGYGIQTCAALARVGAALVRGL